MLSSHGGGVDHDDHDSTNLTTNHYHHNLSRVSTKSTTLSSSSSSNTSSNHSPFLNNTTRTMEEVWKDINLPTSNDHAAGTKGYRGFILQDFLAKPFSSTHDTNTHTTVSSPPPPPPPPPQQPQPQMLLNLNSGPDQLSFLGHEDPIRNVCPLEGPFDQVLASSNSLGHSMGGLRMLPATDRTGGDRRHKRMIKNRESAARSRARKQAYTNELENEVERLKEENAMLKRQQQQLQVATAAQMTKKGGLQRTSTAPF
ncbi:bZIP transcription factor FD [Artemisia annua]|uniref:BZIP transcription factor FD n=1 Tax=Artemisia annua TaxID=35608 RepID=A0A2U1M8W7_ARTAN|nr:bZIP transcription factor FD [Artemisia annua]